MSSRRTMAFLVLIAVGAVLAAVLVTVAVGLDGGVHRWPGGHGPDTKCRYTVVSNVWYTECD